MTAPPSSSSSPWRAPHPTITAPHKHPDPHEHPPLPLARTVSAPYSTDWAHARWQQQGPGYAQGYGGREGDGDTQGQQEANGYLSPSSPPGPAPGSVQHRASYTSLSSYSYSLPHPHAATYDPYADPGARYSTAQPSQHPQPQPQPQPQPPLPHSYSSPTYPASHYQPTQPPWAHSAPLSAHYPHPSHSYSPPDIRADLAPAPPPRPAGMENDPWSNPAPAYEHPELPSSSSPFQHQHPHQHPESAYPHPATSYHQAQDQAEHAPLLSRPAPPLPSPSNSTYSLPPLPPKPPFYSQQHNPSSSTSSGGSGWTIPTPATPGLTRDSGIASDLLGGDDGASLWSGRSGRSAETLPPFSDSLPPGYSLSNALQAVSRSSLPAPHPPPPSKKAQHAPARQLPDLRLLELREQETRDRELALRLAQEDVPGGGVVRRETGEWGGFDEVAHADVREGKGKAGAAEERELELEREDREAQRRREQEDADRAFALELQRQYSQPQAHHPSSSASPLPPPSPTLPPPHPAPAGGTAAVLGLSPAAAAAAEDARSPEEIAQAADASDAERRRRQEEEDAAFARRVMEEMRVQEAAEELELELELERRREREAADSALARELQADRAEDEAGRRAREAADARLAQALQGERAAQEGADALLARQLQAERQAQEGADEELARRLDAEASVDKGWSAHPPDGQGEKAPLPDLPDLPAEDGQGSTPTQPRFSPARSPVVLQPQPHPHLQPQAATQLSPPLPSPTQAHVERDRSPAREIPELDDDGWQVYDPRSFDGSAGGEASGSGTGREREEAGDGREGTGGQQGSRHTEVWIRPGVQQQQQQQQPHAHLSPPASQLSPPAPGTSPSSASSSSPHPAFPQPQPLPLLPTPTSPSSALHPLNPFRDYEEPPLVDISTPPPSSPPPPFSSPPRPTQSPPAPRVSPGRRPTLLPENIAFDLHSLSNGAPGFPTPQPLGTPGSPPMLGNPLSLYPQVFHRVDVPIKAEQQFSPPALVTSPPADPPSDTDSGSLRASSARSPSPGALSPSRSSSFKSRPAESWVPTLPDSSPSTPGVTRTSSSASTKSTASARSGMSFHTAQRASTAASLATALEDLEPEDGEDGMLDGALSPRTPGSGVELVRTPSEGPLSPGPSPHLQAIEGIAIGLNAPANDTLFHHRHLDPIVFPELVLLAAASPLYISAPTYRALLRALAHFGTVRVEAPPALIATVKTVVQTNAVVQFSRPSQQSRQWRCILHLEVHPSQQDGEQKGRGRAQSRIPARTNTLNTVVHLPQPSPALPFTMSSLADYLRKALSDSRSAASDQGKALHRAVVQSDPEEAAKSASAEPTRQGLLGVFGIGRNKGRADLNEDTYDLVTPFILSDT